MTKEERQAARKAENEAFKESLKSMTKEEKQAARQERKETREANKKEKLEKNENALTRRKNIDEIVKEENAIWKQIVELIK